MGIRNKNPVKRGCFFFNLKTQVPTSCFWSWFFVLPFLSLYQPFKNYLALSFLHQASLVAQMVKNLLAMWETWVQSLGWLGRSPREGNGYPLQYSGLENSTDYTAHGVTKELDTTDQFSLTSLPPAKPWPYENQDSFCLVHTYHPSWPSWIGVHGRWSVHVCK